MYLQRPTGGVVWEPILEVRDGRDSKMRLGNHSIRTSIPTLAEFRTSKTFNMLRLQPGYPDIDVIFQQYLKQSGFILILPNHFLHKFVCHISWWKYPVLVGFGKKKHCSQEDNIPGDVISKHWWVSAEEDAHLAYLCEHSLLLSFITSTLLTSVYRTWIGQVQC